MKYASKTDIGQRLRNEDACLVPQAEEARPLAAVADGMGGHAAGELASRLLIEGLVREREALALSSDPGDALEKAIQRINVEMFRTAQSDESLRGMGSTLVCALLLPERYFAASIGDSRIYHLHDDTLEQVSEDHSLVEMLVQSGQITREEARLHPQRNLITRAAGLALRAQIDLFERPWQNGDMLLLCSDGLHGSVTDDEIYEILRGGASLDEAAEALVSLALERGASDNITIVLVQNDTGEECV